MGWEISERFDPLYVALLVKTRTLKDLADVSSVPQINNKHIDPILFPAPPIAEQATILSQLDRDLAGFNTAVVRTQNEIDLLREYRTRLIADAVTGKLDVREAAANLPNETGEAETLDDIETLAEGDGDGESANLDVVPEEAEA
jgi:type I restriction enzyme S subunit